MSYSVKSGNIFGRIGAGLAKGLSEQLPKEVERHRLSSGLEQLNKQEGLSPRDYFTKSLGIPGVVDRPQVIQSLEKLARQQSVIDSTKERQRNIDEQLRNQNRGQRSPSQNNEAAPSATTTEGVEATLNPYIPPSGEEVENRARQLVADEPYIYPNLEDARAAVNNQIAADAAQSSAQINKRGLQQDVQSKAEDELKKEITARGVQIPARSKSRLDSQAIDDVRTGKLTEKQAAKKYGEEADKLSRDFAKVRGWGGIDLITNKHNDLRSSIRSIQEKYPERLDRRDFADEMIGENRISPQFAYGMMLPVNKVPELNKELKNLKDIKPKISKSPSGGGLAGLGYGRSKNIDPVTKTREISPQLLKTMGKEGSPLAVAYELEKKGYDPQVWKDYALEHKGELTGDQYEELGITQKAFSGALNDLWFKSFTGIE